MFIKVPRYQSPGGSIMLLNTDNITSVIDRQTHLEIRDTADRVYDISETFNEFYNMVCPRDPVTCELQFKHKSRAEVHKEIFGIEPPILSSPYCRCREHCDTCSHKDDLNCDVNWWHAPYRKGDK